MGESIRRHGEYRLTSSGDKLQLLQAAGLKSKGHPGRPWANGPSSQLASREPGLPGGGLLQPLGPRSPRAGWEEGWRWPVVSRHRLRAGGRGRCRGR